MQPDLFYLDSNVVMEIVETRCPLSAPQFSLISDMDAGNAFAVTSELTIAECLVKPFADGDDHAAAMFLAFLDGRASLRTLPVGRDILLHAAHLRTTTRLKLPDAIHMATALDAGCTAFITNDRDFRGARGMRVIAWEEFVR